MRILSLIAAGVLAASSAAAGSPVVVELFTSQGCSSCPPADRFMEELSRTQGVVALTLPVDIWDYLGWRDTFAKREFSLRQQAYAPHMPSKSVFTPQMVVGGRADTVGSRRGEVLALIEAQAAEPGGADVALTLEGGALRVRVTGAQARSGTATVWLARVLSSREVNIGDGENRGRVIVYSNVVRHLAPIGMTQGGAADLTAPADLDIGEIYDRFAVVVQDGEAGPILGAAMIDAAR